MPVIGFTVFREAIESGQKRQTIRRAWKHPIKVGDKLYLYWKLRTNHCERILPKADSLAPICIERLRIPWRELADGSPFAASVAVLDGFHSRGAFESWFIEHYDPQPDTMFDIIRW